MSGITFVHPKMFFLLLLVPAFVAWYIWKQKDTRASLQMSSLMPFGGVPASLRVYLRHLPFVLRMVALVMVVLVLARPQSFNVTQNIETEGIDIMISLDISSSMLAQDFKPDRLEAAKDIAIQFVSGRQNDRIGVVIFAGESFTLCPLTSDLRTVANQINSIELGLIEDGTAIGVGLANAVARLKESDAMSKVVILLTDGVNNMGEIAPLTAADIASTFGVRVYTVGVGTHGTAPYPVQTPFGTRMQDMKVEIDEDVLKQIADITGGQYFRATDGKGLARVYEQIDELEKTKIEVIETTRKSEEFLRFALLALLMLTLDIVLRTTVLRSVP
ncbi:VWA domain-containing protein [Bacteroidales bacterium M08MB]|jgi:Ca-activated chloride channel family protein|nr:VWA domain-containing protein [Perlabentimonas gracilis]NHB68516.1 VWA domain-containing protein [Perlabentimonas gracilis]